MSAAEPLTPKSHDEARTRGHGSQAHVGGGKDRGQRSYSGNAGLERATELKILAVDVGQGTKDILLYDSESVLENCIKLILPSPTRVYAQAVRRATQAGEDLLLTGSIIGGGPLSGTLRRHVAGGRQVLISEGAAFTIRNDLEEIAQMGIKVVREAPRDFKGRVLRLSELDLDTLSRFMATVGEDLHSIDCVAVAVQDHGPLPKGASHRRSRLGAMKGLLEKSPHPWALAFSVEEVPEGHVRMHSVARECHVLPQPHAFLMDTAPAAICGCLEDPQVKAVAGGDILAVNVGNGHTMAALVGNGVVRGVFEHHTRLLEPRKLGDYLRRFADGAVTDEEVFTDGGHGAFYLDTAPTFARLKMVAVTGPNRALMGETGLPIHYAMPGGDVAITGPLGLVAAIKTRLEKG